MILTRQTGYPSIDKPHLSKHLKEPVADIFEYDNTYDLIFAHNNMNDIAIYYLDGNCAWTFGKLKKKTDLFIKGFKKQGIKEGDNVLFGTLATPEFVAVAIALISIGAVLKGFDIRASEKDIVKYATSSNCTYAIALDVMVLEKFKRIIDETDLKRVFVLRPANSLSGLEKVLFAAKNIASKSKINKGKVELPVDKRFLELTRICKDYKDQTVVRVEVDYSRPCIKVQSSGTTGKSKTIVHSEKSIVEFARATAFMDATIRRGIKTRVFVALPPWIAYGIGNAIINPLVLGACIDLSVDFEPDAVYRSIGRFDMVYAAPFHYRYVRDHYDELSEKKKKELSQVGSFVAGGDKYSAKENKEDEEKFGTIIVNGYGNNEDWGCMTVNPDHNNHYGSVGVPKPGEVVVIYDNDNQCELPYGEVGEICSLSKTMFLEYENDAESTEKVKKLHKDGQYYLHTGDLGYIDEEGYLFVIGRKERVITRLGFKLSAYTIEDTINNFSLIKECIAVEVPDNLEEHVPMVFIVPEKEINIDDNCLVDRLKSYCKENLKENEIPKYFLVVDALKYTDGSKYDFRYYEEYGSNYVKALCDH